MKKMGVFLVTGSIAVALALLLLFGDQIIMFILAGAIPFTAISIPPLFMIVFWVLLAAFIMIAPRLISERFWSLVECLAQTVDRQLRHQRSLILERAYASHHQALGGLVASTYLYELSQTDENTTTDESALQTSPRRRYATLPS